MFPDPILKIGDLEIYAYGVCMAVGIIACFVFLLWTFWYKNFNEECVDKMIFLGVIATGIGIVFAMLFQSVYNYIENPKAGFKFGDMTFLGGLIGGVGSYLLVYNLYVYVIAPRTKIKWLQNNMNASLLDAVPFIPIGITIAHAFGRLGCTMAGCCYGMEADWGIYFETAGTKVIPTQLFECVFLVLLTIVMVVLYFKFRFNCNLSIYLIAYGVWRFIIEFFRDDHRGEFVAGLTPSQFWCILMVAIGIGYFFAYKYIFKKRMKHPELQPRVNGKKKESVADSGSDVESGNQMAIQTNGKATAKTIDGKGICSIVRLAAFVITGAMVVMAIIGICINWVSFSAQLADGLFETEADGITLSRLFELFGGLDGKIGGAFKTMSAFSILSIIFIGITIAFAVLCKKIGGKPLTFILFVVAMLCIVFGLVSTISSFAFCDIASVDVGAALSGTYTVSAGALLTAIGSIISGFMGVLFTVLI